MGSRHSTHDRNTRQMVTIYLTISIAVAFAAIVAAVVVRTADGATANAHAPAAVPSPEVPISQEGRLVSVSPTSVTAQGPDGVPRTYVVNEQTNAITGTGSKVGETAGSFGVNDEVAILGVVRNGTAVATAVAHRDVSRLEGPPMDYVSP